MMLEGTNFAAAVGWVREDLDDCLEKVRENLEAYAEDKTQQDALQAV